MRVSAFLGAGALSHSFQGYGVVYHEVLHNYAQIYFFSLYQQDPYLALWETYLMLFAVLLGCKRLHSLFVLRFLIV
jgi:hypothetical protein